MLLITTGVIPTGTPSARISAPGGSESRVMVRTSGSGSCSADALEAGIDITSLTFAAGARSCSMPVGRSKTLATRAMPTIPMNRYGQRRDALVRGIVGAASEPTAAVSAAPDVSDARERTRLASEVTAEGRTSGSRISRAEAALPVLWSGSRLRS